MSTYDIILLTLTLLATFGMLGIIISLCIRCQELEQEAQEYCLTIKYLQGEFNRLSSESEAELATALSDFRKKHNI